MWSEPRPSVGSDSEQETVTFIVAEMMWLKNLATDLLANDNEAKICQSDMLTAIGDVEDENGELEELSRGFRRRLQMTPPISRLESGL